MYESARADTISKVSDSQILMHLRILIVRMTLALVVSFEYVIDIFLHILFTGSVEIEENPESTTCSLYIQTHCLNFSFLGLRGCG